jgi:hypothetical protein
MGDRSIIKVHFLDNGYKGLQVTAAMTVDDVLKAVAEKLDLKDTEHFCLYEVNKDVETVLEGNKRPSEIMRAWYERDPTGKSSRFLMKRRLFFRNKALTKDPTCQHMLYIQAVHDVVSSNYPCSVDEAVKLAGIQAYCNYGDFNPSLHKAGFLTTKIHQYIPKLLLPTKSTEEWEKLVLSQYQSLMDSTRSQGQAKVQYLEICMKWHFYGCNFFQVDQQDSTNQVVNPRVYLGINWEGIMVLKHPNKELMSIFPYTDICSWSSSQTLFSIVVGSAEPDSGDDVNVVHPFGTREGKQISDAVQAYIDVLLKELRPEDDDGSMPQ